LSSPPYDIPFNRATLTGRELEYVRQAFDDGHVSGGGPFTRRCEELLSEALAVPRVLLTTSCTDALEMAAMLLEVGEGDEVVVPSFTFVSTALAFVRQGARPVFADITPDTLNLAPASVSEVVGPATRAVVPVHYAGVACDMPGLSAAAPGVAVVEDAAHALFASHEEKALGSFGRLATFSFHETKNFSCGEGGALAVSDPALVARAEILRDKGTNRRAFFRGEVDKYTWVDTGSSFLPADILAAVLWAQLESRDEVLSARRRVWERYSAELSGWAQEHDVRLPVVPAGCEQGFHMFYLRMPSQAARDGLITWLKERRILAVFHYVPLHLSPMGRSFGGEPGQCPVAEEVSDTLVRLPFYTSLGEGEQARVIDAVRDFTP
jgi:dTDP-4-amino-4,6-dideoxygalactose transaminase